MELTDSQLELSSKLTTLQRKFVINLVGSSMSQREAYIAAGGKAKTESAQDNSASVMLSNSKVKAFYDSLINQAASSAILSREEALSILSSNAKITIGDVADFKLAKVGEDDNGEPVYQTVWTIKNSDDIAPHVLRAVKSVSIGRDGPKIELHDQHQAIKQISDMQGWNAPKKTELTGKDGGAIAIDADVKAPEIVSALAGLMDKL